LIGVTSQCPVSHGTRLYRHGIELALKDEIREAAARLRADGVTDLDLTPEAVDERLARSHSIGELVDELNLDLGRLRLGPNKRHPSADSTPNPTALPDRRSSSTLLGRCKNGGEPVEGQRLGAEGAGAEDEGEHDLQFAHHLVEGHPGAGAFGSDRSRVQKAWARTARVTWRGQPVNERPSKWS